MKFDIELVISSFRRDAYIKFFLNGILRLIFSRHLLLFKQNQGSKFQILYYFLLNLKQDFYYLKQVRLLFQPYKQIIIIFHIFM